TGEENSCRGVGKYCASDALVEPLLIVLSGYSTRIIRPEVGFPSQATIERKLWGRLPGVLYIKPEVILAEILCRNLILPPLVRFADNQTRERQPGGPAVERKPTARPRAGGVIHVGVDIVHSESQLVCAANGGQIFGKLPDH